LFGLLYWTQQYYTTDARSFVPIESAEFFASTTADLQSTEKKEVAGLRQDSQANWTISCSSQLGIPVERECRFGVCSTRQWLFAVARNP
jgi:hypothetical protein